MRQIVCPVLLCLAPGCTSSEGPADRADATAAPDGFELPEAGAACDHREPPAPPDSTPSDGAQADASDIVFAVSETDYGSQLTDAGSPQSLAFGFDLDHTCTGFSRCVEPGAFSAAALHAGPDGTDNAYRLVSGPFFPATVAAASYRTELLFRLRGYAGQIDQNPVDVSLYLALGLSARDDGGVGPFWDGQDRWTILPEVLAISAGGPSVNQPLFHADRAYVTGGVLVAEFDRTLLPAGLTNVPRLLATARQLTIAGRLVPPGDAGSIWQLRDLMAGFRVGLTDSLKTFAHTPTDPGRGLSPPDSGPIAVFCDNPTTYGTDKQALCGIADVTADPSAPPTVTCDAVSVGVLFQAAQAQLGGVAGPAPDLPPCAPGINPNDTCDSVGDR